MLQPAHLTPPPLRQPRRVQKQMPPPVNQPPRPQPRMPRLRKPMRQPVPQMPRPQPPLVRLHRLRVRPQRQPPRPQRQPQRPQRQMPPLVNQPPQPQPRMPRLRKATPQPVPQMPRPVQRVHHPARLVRHQRKLPPKPPVIVRLPPSIVLMTDTLGRSHPILVQTMTETLSSPEVFLYNTTDNVVKIYTGSAWVAAYVSGGSFAQLSGATFTGDVTVPNLITAGNVDGRDVSADGTKLDGIAAGADVFKQTSPPLPVPHRYSTMVADHGIAALQWQAVSFCWIWHHYQTPDRSITGSDWYQ